MLHDADKDALQGSHHSCFRAGSGVPHKRKAAVRIRMHASHTRLRPLHDNEEVRSDLRRKMLQRTETLDATAEEKGLVTSADVDNDLEV